MAQPRIRLTTYGPTSFDEREIASPDELADCPKAPVLWLDMDGTADEALVRHVARHFDIHPLALEDVLQRHQRAKVDTYDKHDFIVIRMLDLNGKLVTEQLSIFLGKGFVLTFQEKAGGDPFDHVRDRLRQAKGPLRTSGADMLVYALLDAVVDAYFPVLEDYGDQLEELEEEVVERPQRGTLAKVHDVKRDLLRIRRAVWPLREALSTLGREQTPFVAHETRVYLRDLHDQTVQVMDLIETYRDLGSGLTDLYLSSVSNRLNEVMKVLTIISTIFIPLSFIAGLYGMNFDRSTSKWNMPELGWRWGYPFALGVMALTALGMLAFFVKKGWLLNRAPPDVSAE